MLSVITWVFMCVCVCVACSKTNWACTDWTPHTHTHTHIFEQKHCRKSLSLVVSTAPKHHFLQTSANRKWGPRFPLLSSKKIITNLSAELGNCRSETHLTLKVNIIEGVGIQDRCEVPSWRCRMLYLWWGSQDHTLKLNWCSIASTAGCYIQIIQIIQYVNSNVKHHWFQTSLLFDVDVVWLAHCKRHCFHGLLERRSQFEGERLLTPAQTQTCQTCQNVDQENTMDSCTGYTGYRLTIELR